MDRKGITPVIAIIVLLFITIALAGAAWTYLQGFLLGQISKTFSIPTNGAYCESGRVKVYIVNTAYQATLTLDDFILADVDGTPITLTNLPLEQGKGAKVVDTNCGTGCTSGYHTVNLGTSSTVVHQRVYCP